MLDYHERNNMGNISKRAKTNNEAIDKDKVYSISEALELIKKTATTKFVGSVEVHVRTSIDPKKTDQKMIAAEGEFMSSQKLADTADIMQAHPIALQLRNLQTMAEISVEKNSTIIFPAQFMSTITDIQKFMSSEHAVTKNKDQ